MPKKKASVSLSSGTKRPNFTLISEDSRRFEKLFDAAMYYIHYEYHDKKLKSEAVKYAKSKKLDFKSLEKLDNYYFNVVGKPCVILNNGGDVPDEWKNHLEAELPKLIEKGQQILETTEPKKRTANVQDYISDRAGCVAGMLEEWVDDFLMNPSAFKKKNLDPLSLLRKEEVKPAHARVMIKMFEPCVAEMAALVKGDDKELVEAYSHLNKTQRKFMFDLYSSFITSAETIIKECPVTKRKKKPVSASKLVSKMKYLSEFPDLSLNSVPAVEIVGAKALWVYNTRTRKIGKYVALDDSGLSVKGTTILNFDTTQSVEKTVRKPVEKLKEFKKARVTKLKTFLDELTTIDIPLKGRINEHCILLKIQ